MWSAGFFGIVGDSIQCCTHPDTGASPWLLSVVLASLMLFAGLRAVLIYVQRPSHSRVLRTALGVETLFLYVIDRLGAFGDCTEGHGSIFNGMCSISLLR